MKKESFWMMKTYVLFKICVKLFFSFSKIKSVKIIFNKNFLEDLLGGTVRVFCPKESSIGPKLKKLEYETSVKFIFPVHGTKQKSSQVLCLSDTVISQSNHQPPIILWKDWNQINDSSSEHRINLTFYQHHFTQNSPSMFLRFLENCVLLAITLREL